MPIVFECKGRCPICRRDTIYRAEYKWLRDHLICSSCPNGSIPRERAMMVVLENTVPHWRSVRIHESSPAERGLSAVLRRDCKRYVRTHFYPGVPLGAVHSGFRCEDLERQTFQDAAFDIVITQDVMEHVFEPALAHREIWRTLAAGGVHIHTTPIYKQRLTSERRAERMPDGSVKYLFEPEYHGNPVAKAGSLVTFHYGHDLPDLIAKWAPFDVEVRRFNDETRGILGEFTDVIVCRKR